MLSPFIFWPWFAGLVFLTWGLIAFRTRVIQAPGIEKMVALGPVFYAVPLAVFSAEHLAGAQFLMNIVPPWMPGRLFWAYFVGVALIGAAISLILNRYVPLTGFLLGVMFFSFVILIHSPRVIANPRDRFAWAVVLRDLSFGGAAWALAGSERHPRSPLLIHIGTFIVAGTMLFFGVEHFMHPSNAPGVPLEKMMLPWVPIGPAWSYLTGAALFITGIALLIRKRDRMAAAWTGLLITILVLVVYSPMLAVASKPSEMNEAENYIADTLLYAGTVLLVAKASPAAKN